ncbi:transglycosylase SLT domain protein [Paraburkholderia xenovorans LB400]|uniref:Soluble lytic murein transglycosylase-related protein n=2 Tax=Paraburkholderia xenovorans TaxID=36873 RepID=Q13J42_PARXL|nr:putative soluble lytic murein transglycosylase- related protein [Paraburkholderia xenovorans LB400]AIP37051.1 transglycosylase SLT domain protein [Paraburkholderia xenovorans LB400]
MHGDSALQGLSPRRRTDPYPATRGLKIMLAAIMFPFAAAAHAAETDAAAQSAVSAPLIASDATLEAGLPTLSDITAVLRAQFRVAPAESLQIARAVLTEADRHAISPILLLAVMAVESSFDRYAVSVAGARGLMQILPAAHPQLIAGAADLTDPAINVRIGSTILRRYLDQSGGDLDAALLRYSGGGRGYARRVVLRMRSFDASLGRE